MQNIVLHIKPETLQPSKQLGLPVETSATSQWTSLN